MRKFLVGLPAALLFAQASWGATCGDTTVVISGAGQVTYNTASLNTVIAGCDDSTMVITLENATGNDTVKFNNEIVVTSRPAGSSTAIVGKGRDGGSFIVTENTATDPNLFDIRSPDKTTLSNITVVRKADNQGGHSVILGAKGSIIRDCHLFRTDNGSVAGGALVYVTADSVLVERCLFRAPPNGKGRTIGITNGGGSNRNEYRSNIFYSTGIYLTAGSAHIFANTFAGSRDDYNAIIVGQSVTNPATAINIQHNLFALKSDLLSPIVYGGTNTSTDSVIKNAWSRPNASVFLTSSQSGQQVTTNNTAGANANVELKKGFSRYGSHIADFKEYPLVTLRSDENLPRNHADFGKIPRVYNNSVSSWTTMPDISADFPSNKLYFSGSNTFTPFIQGTSWTSVGAGAGTKVGALVDLEARITPPSPLDSGTLGKGLVIIRSTQDSTKMKVTNINLMQAYYDTTIPPGNMMFFFSTTQSKLAANDSTALKNATSGTPYYYSRAWLGFDSSLTVPKEVRVGGNPIFVKMLHYNGGGQAAVLSAGAIAQVTGIPGFPINDLSVPALDLSNSDTTKGSFTMVVTKQGSESIDSVTITVTKASGGGIQEVKSKAAPTSQGGTVSINFDLPAGNFQFSASPVAKVGANPVTGASTALSRVYKSRDFVGDTVYVANSTANCGSQDGTTPAKALCTIDAALTILAPKNGGTIIVRNGTPATPFSEITIGGSDTANILITVPSASGAFDPAHRVAFRGSAGKEALTITRRNVTIRGLTIEMPAASTAPAVTVAAGAAGTVIDGCLFRPITRAEAAGPAVSINTSGNGDMRFISNVVWGFTRAVRVNSGSTAVRILHNTFIDEPGVTTATTIGISAPSATMNAVVANNFFSGIDTAFDVDVLGKTPKLDHNIYTVAAPELRGQSELGGLDNVTRLGALDLTAATWVQDLKLAMETITDCSVLKPCQTLYAGSSADSYGSPIQTDVFGKPRIGKPEVGAVETEASSSSLRGVLTMAVGSLPINSEGAQNRLPFTVTRKVFDPADADSLYVWWATGAEVLLGSVPAGNQRRYAISDLSSGTLQDTAKGLTSNTTYYIYAALGKTTGGTRLLGYGYRASGQTQAGVTVNDCKFGPTNPFCPNDVEFFVVPDGDAKGLFFTKVSFALPDTGYVNLPQFAYGQKNYSGGRVVINSALPLITLDISAELTKAANSKQHWTASIRMRDDPGSVLNDKELFLLPADETSLPTYVPTWRLYKQGNDAWLEIQGTKSGRFTYGFGSMSSTAEAGKMAMTNPAEQPPRFNFKTAGTVDTVTLTVRGSGFATANPLILVTPISAGGTFANPFSEDYQNKTLVISAGLADLDASLRNDRFYQYYQAAVSADSTAPAPTGTNKPFVLPEMDDKEFLAVSMVSEQPSVSVSPTGETGEMTLKLPIFPKYAESIKYPDSLARTSRSIEVVFTTFDGAKISRTSGYIRSEFSDEGNHKVHTTEKKQFAPRVWNLFSYPWDEADTGSLAKVVKATSWNSNERRLMKYKGTGSGSSAFISYDGSSSDGITYDSGMAAWSASAGYYEPSCASGISLDYRTFEMKLAGGVWNDFGLPFNFPMKWIDILTLSGSSVADLPTWRYRAMTDQAPAGWEALDGNSVVRPWQGFATKPGSEKTLKFPVLDYSRSATPLTKAAAPSLWTADIRAYNATALMSLRIGKAAKETTFPEAPDVPGQDFRLALSRVTADGKEKVSRFIQGGEDWRGHWALEGNASKAGIRLAIEKNERETPLYLVEILSRKAVPLVPGSEVSLSQEELASGDYHLVAGDSRYLEEVLDGMVPLHMLALSNYPNPFSGSTVIRYSLPESFGKVEFRMKIRDSRGRLVWEKTQRGSNTLRYLWDGREGGGKVAAAGFYTLTLEAVTPGKATQRAVRRLLKM